MRRIWALDFGAEATTVVVAEEKGRRDYKLLAKAESPSRGFEDSRIAFIGDVVESVYASVKEAEKMCSLKCDKIFYNYDDAAIESARPAGSKALVGEGQIGRSDIADAERIAIRTTGHFEKSVIFSNPIHYLMDGKDSVTNPIGVFGHELEVRLFVLMGKAMHAQKLRRVFERAGIYKTQSVVTALSSCYGVLEDAAMKKRSLVWDLGQDLAQAAVIQQGVLFDYAIFVSRSLSASELTRRLNEVSREIMHRTGFIEEVLLTGDLSEKDSLATSLMDALSLPVSAQIPARPAGLAKAKYASLAGLVYFALDKQARMPQVRPSKEVLAGLKDKTTSFLNDYF